VRDWAAVDYYALLGVTADASDDDIARAFRTVAKRSHPDATGDPIAAERFKELAAAYAVLSDRGARRDYDRVRAATAPVPEIPAAATRTAAPPPLVRWTRTKAMAVLGAGIAVTLLGVAAGVWTWRGYEHDRDARTRSIPVVAVRRGDSMIVFDTPSRRVVTREPTRHGDPSGRGPTVRVRYDRDDPERVILDSSTVARDITLGIVALKLLVGGPVFAELGRRRLRRLARGPSWC
jgi:curved DNA-binding protein CbpA